MTQGKFKFRKSASIIVLSLASASFMGCAGQVEDGDSSNEYQFAVLSQQWTSCAAQGQQCRFSGTHDVRYGKNGQTVTRTFTDGVACNNRSFGVRYGRGNSCEVLLDVESAPADDAMMDHSDHTPAVDAGMDPGSMGGMAMGDAGMMMGPTVNRNAIPTGDPGVSEQQITTTDEKPVPDSEIGAFRTSCLFSHMSFNDPIVFPGQPGASHLHSFFGNSGTDAYSTADSIQNSGNSTCRGGTANRTAYWVPAVIDANGNPVKPSEGQFYYKTGYNGIKPSQIQKFPQGLRMIAGNAKSAAAGQPNAYWGCNDNYNGHPSSIPTCPVGDNIVMYVVFPQCWDGKNLDSSDHKSHMAYASNGACPSTHPVAIPEISFNIYYKVTSSTNSKGWRLASDMYDASQPGGYSAHGDYFEGWDPKVAEAFVNNCDRAQMDCHSHLLGDGRMIYNSHETY
jgi:hypothetical protein